MASQMTPFMLDACGGIGTPMANIAELARRGVALTTTYTPCPIRVPLRSSLTTRLYVSRTSRDYKVETDPHKKYV